MVPNCGLALGTGLAPRALDIGSRWLVDRRHPRWRLAGAEPGTESAVQSSLRERPSRAGVAHRAAHLDLASRDHSRAVRPALRTRRASSRRSPPIALCRLPPW